MAHILVVDDDKMTRAILDQMLEVDGHTCQLAIDCESARKQMKANNYEVIEAGETIEIVGSDPETIKGLFRILQTFSYELLNINDDENPYRIRLRKGRPGNGFAKNPHP